MALALPIVEPVEKQPLSFGETDTVRVLLNRTIEALLSDATIQQRRSAANACISRLERYKNEVPDALNQLKCIMDDLALLDHLSPDRELELTERLLTLYVNASDGALIF